MIVRIWRGWTEPADADRYETLLGEKIFPGILNRRVAGFRDLRLLRREAGDEVEFVVLMRFDSIDAVREFAGDDYRTAYVPEEARAVLARFDERALHYELRMEKEAPARD